MALGGSGVSGRWHRCCSTLFCFSRSGLLAMGNLIKVLGKDLENCPHFFLDFESKSHEQGGCGEGARAAAAAAVQRMGTGTMSSQHLWLQHPPKYPGPGSRSHPLPRRGTFLLLPAPSRQSNLFPHPAPWHRRWGLPRTPRFGAGSALEEGDGCSQGSRDSRDFPASSPPFAPPSPSPHPPALITIGGGRGCTRGREQPRGHPRSPPSPRGAAGGGRGSGRRRCPQPSTSSPGSTSPSCFFPLVSSLAGFTWGTF